MIQRLESDPLPGELDAILRKELDEGENLLWTGQPIPHAYAKHFRPLWGIAAAAMALAFLAVMGLWEQTREFRGVPVDQLPRDDRSNLIFGLVIFGTFGAGMCAAAVYFFTIPFRARAAARRIVYAVTDRRAIILRSNGSFTEERDFRPDELLQLLRRDSRDGEGDVIFEGAHRPRQPHSLRHGFLAVRRSREVERLLRTTFHRSPGS